MFQLINSRLLAALLVVVGASALVACHAPPESDSFEPSDAERHEETIVAARELGTLRARTGEEAFAGVQCSTCHSIPSDKPPAEHPTELEEFHTSMEFTHGALTCNSCHNPDDRDTLRLANGEVIAFADTMDLCAQCHGPKARDYKQGAHGGMSGHWDLTQGGRVRNNCVNCHDPHSPGFPSMMPAPPPRDRFFGAGGH